MTYQEAKDYLLHKARQQGLEVEVLALENRELTLQAQGARLEQITQATQGGIGVRLVVEGKVGYAYTEERSPQALDWVLAEARENALLQSGGGDSCPPGARWGPTTSWARASPPRSSRSARPPSTSRGLCARTPA